MNVLIVRAKLRAENLVEMVTSLKQWYAEPPAVETMTVIGSYRLF
jgi:hypothetical protein